ncbi:MAG: hypothetical protein ACT4O3_01625 [Elusimicrobiota bacterium]
MSRALYADETQWWDGPAMAVDMLLKRPGVRRAKLAAARGAVDWAGDAEAPALPAASGAAAYTVYAFAGLRDVEILRRLNQMPDETPLDLLSQPFAVYCPDIKTLVTVNDPDFSLEEGLERLERREQ